MNKDRLKYVYIPIVIQIIILISCILVFHFLIGENNGSPLVVPSRFEGGEYTNPNLIRLVFLLVMIPLAFVFNYLAGKNQENLLRSFWLAYLGGLFLWQSVGECSWHFMIPIEDYYVTFPRIESVSSAFMIIIAIIATAAVFRTGSFRWSTRVFILSFVMNWFAHFILIGTFPLAQHLMDELTWYKVIGIGFGSISTIITLLLTCRRHHTPKQYLIMSMLIYISIGIIAMGLRGG